ncbi:MAG: MATE family efflux transporter [Oscillospiraceae bacterium]|nr:MATE family efflux transporter [Oscillospiraceae bacterium]
MLQRYIGNRSFYKRTLAIAVPLIIQNGISNFVSLLDNIMVGQVGTLQMSGVSIVNQLMIVLNLCVFGAVAGAGIFTAQYFGSGNHEGIRYSFRFKVLLCLAISALGIAVLTVGDRLLIGLYLQGEGSPEDAAQTLQHGQAYLKVMLWGIVPFAISNAYASTLRECGKASVPMTAGVVAVLTNLALNYCLIYGNLGLPRMGVRGAALATVISRYVELAIVATWMHTHTSSQPYIVGAYRSCYIPGKLLRQFAIKGTPLLINEALFGSGLAMLNQCYSTCGLDVVPALNISSTIYSLSSVVYMSLGNAVGIIMGQMLGAGNTREVVMDANRKLTALSIFCGVVFGGILAAISGIFPMLYSTTDAVRSLATRLILVSAAAMPIHAYIHPVYFTLRSGGKTLITFLFDSGYLWACVVTVAVVLSRFTDMGVVWMYIICNGVEFFKCIMGFFMIRRGSWMQNLAAKTK